VSAPQRGGSELRELLDWAKSLGFTCNVGGKHLVFSRPFTRKVFASYTPSCRYARQNTRRDLLKAIAEAEKNKPEE
jgi:hypothetical protein